MTGFAFVGDAHDSYYSYRDPIQNDALVSNETLFAELVATDAFMRLHQVRFLGGIDYLLVPSPNGATVNTRYTRYQHSLGVALLALRYSKLRELNPSLTRLAYASALLHDIGHGPLSHSLEPVFEGAFGVNHHDATIQLIMGQSQIGQDVSHILLRHGVDPIEVIAVLSGDYDPFEGFFSGPINFDTIEGIMRSRQYALKGSRPVSPFRILIAAINRQNPEDQELVDRFWAYKHEVYNLVIRSRDGVLADYACQEIAKTEISSLSADDYFSTESNLFRKIPRLRKMLTSKSLVGFGVGKSISIQYKARDFYIDMAGDFFKRHDHIRYKQSKRDKTLII